MKNYDAIYRCINNFNKLERDLIKEKKLYDKLYKEIYDKVYKEVYDKTYKELFKKIKQSGDFPKYS